MERNVVSLELAKKLKEAGFDKPTDKVWHNLASVPTVMDAGEWQGLTSLPPFPLFAPTAQELADALPESVKDDNNDWWNFEVARSHGRFVARYSQLDHVHIAPPGANTMADALALLWLEIKSKEE